MKWKADNDEEYSLSDSVKTHLTANNSISIKAELKSAHVLYIDSPKIKLTTNNAPTPKKAQESIGQVYYLDAFSQHQLTLSTSQSASINFTLLTNEELISQQRWQGSLWGMISATLVILSIFALFNSRWLQREAQYLFTAISCSALAFISFHSGLVTTWFNISTNVLSGGFYNIFALLLSLSLLYFTKTILHISKAGKQINLLFIIAISLVITGIILSFILPSSISYILALILNMTSGLLCGIVSIKIKSHKQAIYSLSGYIASWSIYSLIWLFLLIEVIFEVYILDTMLTSLLITTHVFVISLFITEEQAIQIKQAITNFNNKAANDLSLQHAAFHDKLTGLPNKLALELSFNEKVISSQNKEWAVMVFKIKDFDNLNQSLGFATSDLVLVQTARRINRFLRAYPEVLKLNTDKQQDEALAALGGVRYAFLVEVSNKKHLLDKLVYELEAILPEPIAIDSIVVDIECALGIAHYPHDGLELNGLLQCAHTALEYSVSNHKLVSHFSEQQEQITTEQKALLAELSEAIKNEQLKLVVLPVINMENHEIVAGETLVRWRHPNKGLIPPNEFITLAEKTGVIYSLTRWVLRRSIEALAEWQKHELNINISVNLSNKDLLQHELIDYISHELKTHSLRPSLLTLEINESALATDPTLAHDVLSRLNELGIKCVIDDFGTGFSSLEHIRKTPLAGLKIDRSFIKSLTEGDTAKTIVNTVIDIGRNMKLDVIAEGVEDQDIEFKLKQMGCTQAQGFLYSKPFELEGFVSWYRHWQKNQAEQAKAKVVISSDIGEPITNQEDIVNSSPDETGLNESTMNKGDIKLKP